ncbi:hypothetical protein BC332_00624 [Capsicum chinense]|nr:hypothetical protein BC332_00624 [Capsicum chinense]
MEDSLSLNSQATTTAGTTKMQRKQSTEVEKAQKAQTKEKELEVQVLAQKQWSTTVAPVQSTSGKGTKSCADEVEEKTMQSETAHSIWDRFEISKVWNAGFKLDYVAPMKQGEKPLSILISRILNLNSYWKSVVVCYVLGAHPQFAVINGFIRRIWGKYRLNKVAMLNNKVIIVRFETIEGENEVLQGGIYHFDNKPFIVKAWVPEMEFTREELQSGDRGVVLGELEHTLECHDFGYYRRFKVEEVSEAVRKMRKGRATGPDEILVDF